MDRICKKILNKMISTSRDTAYLYSFSTSEGDIFIDHFADRIGINRSNVRSAMDYLAENGYLEYAKNGETATGFHLSHKGLNWKAFRRADVLNYIADKWVDILASIISMLSLVISIIALMQG